MKRKKTIALLLALCMLIAHLPCVASAEDSATLRNCASLHDLKTWLLNYAQPYYTSLTVYYGPELDSVMADDERIGTMLYNSGMMKWVCRINREKRILRVTDIEYMAGYRIAYAHLNGDYQYLKDQEEFNALNNALTIVSAAQANTSTVLEMERFFHDWLCSYVVYTASDVEYTYYDNCVGALNGGAAECDGYSDAFYLLCKLAGIPVGYQHGYTYDHEKQAEDTHLWNVVYIDDTWVHVDVTWDDRDYQDDTIRGTQYTYFNTCDYTLNADHKWFGDCTVYPMAYYMDWDLFFYSCAQAGQSGFGAYYETPDDAASYARTMQKQGWEQFHFMVKGYYPDGVEMNEVLLKRGLRGMWRTWTSYIEGYTCFDVYME